MNKAKGPLQALQGLRPAAARVQRAQRGGTVTNTGTDATPQRSVAAPHDKSAPRKGKVRAAVAKAYGLRSCGADVWWGLGSVQKVTATGTAALRPHGGSAG